MAASEISARVWPHWSHLPDRDLSSSILYPQRLHRYSPTCPRAWVRCRPSGTWRGTAGLARIHRPDCAIEPPGTVQDVSRQCRLCTAGPFRGRGAVLRETPAPPPEEGKETWGGPFPAVKPR